ncbi:hypothetical protein FHR24_001801 [Wenyingzhuangia heitensis]|uniref:DUF5689 domain-containing protein n=1 Tax=Wenyingzhuangia heitensis TaxID=1487859 RepID=A0ABX0UAN3_9FLAO|nr:SwmB domain-containing protein [Wenyingzhuangia heitensis]NIJ45333.1 hypothetical protein [Wenyingzhuangia heitensis]
MKNKIIKKIILGTLLLLAVVSCTSEYADYTAPDEINDTSWMIGLDPNASGDDRFSINIDTYISFLDLSQGQKEHRWIIEKGNFFLKERFTAADSLPLFIKNNDTVTKNAKAHVFFRKKGVNKIRLFNTYNAPVTNKTSIGTLTSVKVGNQWVIDTTFTFDVYGHIKPSFKILQAGTEKLVVTADELTSIKNKDSWPIVEVEAGGSLTYQDLTTEGRPTSRRWQVENASPLSSNLKEATIKFFKLGTYDAGNITVLRGVSEGINYPTASTTKIIPLKVKVIKSNQPFAINGQIKETKEEVLRFQVTGELAPFTAQESFFTVNVANGTFNQNISVTNAKVSETDATFIELTLDQPIYNSDIITVNYAGGTIMSSDERTLESFTTPIKVVPYFGNNILSFNKGFEDATTSANSAFASTYWVGNTNSHGAGFYYERTTDKFASGSASMKFESTDTTPFPTPFISSNAFAAPDGIPAGTYSMSLKLFIESGSDIKAFRTIVNKPTWVQRDWNLESIERGKWIELKQEIVFTGDVPTDASFQLRILSSLNPGVTGAQKLYIDDISIVAIELRP